MKMLCFSDTHQMHRTLRIPECDVLIFAGDCCSAGNIWELENFAMWLKDNSSNFNKLLMVSGNHDWCFMQTRILAVDVLKTHLGDKVEYLEDSECVIDGVKFYGTPWQPEFNSWAFNLPRGERLRTVWDNIPEDTNVLITHSPPHGIGDFVENLHVGCMDLLVRISKLNNLFLHVFGHIHSARGIYLSDAIPNVNFCNVSMCGDDYALKNDAILCVKDKFSLGFRKIYLT